MKSLPTKDPRRNVEGREDLSHQKQTLVQSLRIRNHSSQSPFRTSAPTCVKTCGNGEYQLRATLTLNRRLRFVNFDCGILPMGSNLWYGYSPLEEPIVTPLFLITAFPPAYGRLPGCDSKNHGGKFCWKCQIQMLRNCTYFSCRKL